MLHVEINKAIARQWLELVSDHDIETICGMTSPTWRMHGGPPSLPPGPAGIRALFGTMGVVIQRWTVEEVIAEGNLVVVRARNTCVQDSFLGIPGRGIRKTFSAMFMHRIVGGLVEETWRNPDDRGRVVQLGAVFAPA